MFGLGPTEMLIVLVIGVLLFGKNLPNVGRQLGKSLMEFKKGLDDIKSEVNAATYIEPSRSPAPRQYSSDDYDEPTAPKFEPPAQEPFEPPPHDAGAASSQSENTPTEA
jgi:sec-independent protein translocase protein TatA